MAKNKNIKKISIIGAGGVGSNLAFAILNRIPPQELVLIDISPGLAEGICLDLEDTRGFLNFITNIKGSSDYSDIKNSDIVVITAGVARKEGMSRLDLLKINAEIVKNISCQIRTHAPHTIVIVVTNPLDFVTYIVAKETQFPRHRILGMGSSLDTSRLFNLLYTATKIPVAAIKGFVYGAHSNDMIVSLERIKIKGRKLSQFIDKEKIGEIERRVQLRGSEIVSYLKTRSASFAPAISICFLIETIVKDTKKIIPVSVLLKGEYGLKDVCVGVPCIINRNGIGKIIEIKLTPYEKLELQKTEKLFKECMISQ
jgi:malate dehydrogenase